MPNVISKDGTTIAYDQYGQGDALILVGGALQYRALDQNTKRLAELLAQDFTVFHYDRRGRGDSSDTQPYAKERELEDLAALIDETGGSASVFAMSSGSVLALDAAASGLAITKLAVYEPPFVVDDSRAPLPSDYVTQLNALVAAGQLGDAVAYQMMHAADVPAPFVEQMRNFPFWPAFEAVAHTLAYDGAFMGETMSGSPLSNERWTAVSIPVLVLVGGASPNWLQSGSQALLDVLMNAQHRVLEGQTHDVAPEVLAPALTEFFRG
jgi:pimeloyl-ACP methyl ester carboxylesterase